MLGKVNFHCREAILTNSYLKIMLQQSQMFVENMLRQSFMQLIITANVPELYVTHFHFRKASFML